MFLSDFLGGLLGGVLGIPATAWFAKKILRVRSFERATKQSAAFLIGGNLFIVVALMGKPYDPVKDGASPTTRLVGVVVMASTYPLWIKRARRRDAAALQGGAP